MCKRHNSFHNELKFKKEFWKCFKLNELEHENTLITSEKFQEFFCTVFRPYLIQCLIFFLCFFNFFSELNFFILFCFYTLPHSMFNIFFYVSRIFVSINFLFFWHNPSYRIYRSSVIKVTRVYPVCIGPSTFMQQM